MNHLLRLDNKLILRIKRSQKKYRPYLKSRNYFITELIESGLDKMDGEYKIYGGKNESSK